jgi:hypothetical protein
MKDGPCEFMAKYKNIMAKYKGQFTFNIEKTNFSDFGLRF